MANRLQNEKSLYLLQHKDNPVDWYPWGTEAFETAAHEDKPVFLSIGYAACHWCHVMAHESFADAQVAQALRDFVCIKVDRQERPDIDAVYMQVCQAFTGSGGWPLTVLMTAQQKPFFAGTYFPKHSKYGQMGLLELLHRISDLWQNDRKQLLDAGEQVTQMLLKSGSADPAAPEKVILKQAYAYFAENFDPTFGGFGYAPKFPTPHNLLFLLRYHWQEKSPEALMMVEKTLDAMANGGIFDHIGGGFSRYSTDEKWLIPHFEKMLYDNALLLLAYVETYQLTGHERHAQTVRRTADYILRELTDPCGGFYSGQDADSEGEEGKYYAFTPQEIKAVLGQERGDAFCRLYGIDAAGNFAGKSIPNRIGRDPQTDISEISAPEIEAHEIEALYRYRKARAALETDDQMLLSWNAWTILALARAGAVLDETRYLAAAQKARQFLKTNMTDKQDRLLHRFGGGEAAHAGQLDDYAVYALALLELYRVSLDADDLQEAICRAKQMVENFADDVSGGYFLTAHDAEHLISRPKEIYDAATPSGNSVAAVVLQRIASLTADASWQEIADRQLRFAAGQARAYPAGCAFGLLALFDVLYPHRELLCTCKKPPVQLTQYMKKDPLYDISVLFRSKENASLLARIAPFTKDYPPTQDTARYYLCEKGACLAPTDDFAALPLGGQRRES